MKDEGSRGCQSESIVPEAMETKGVYYGSGVFVFGKATAKEFRYE